MPTEPRTWTIYAGDEWQEGHVVEGDLLKAERVRVVELDPVLDLLDRLIDTQSTTRIETWGELYEDAKSFLRAGRGSSS